MGNLFERVLITTDLSAESMAACRAVDDEERFQGADITLLNVRERFELPPVLHRQISNPETVSTMEQEYESNCQAELENAIPEEFKGKDWKLEVTFSDHSPPKAICEYVKEHEISVVVVASHGKGALSRAVLGSSTQALAQMLHCPLLIVPAK